MSLSRALSPLLALSLAAAPALAQSDVSVNVSAAVPVGEAPSLTLQVNKDLERAVLELRGRGPGAPRAKVVRRAGPAEEGSELTFELPPSDKSGTTRWEGSLSVTFGDGATGRMPLSFGTEARQPPRVAPAGPGVQLEENRVTVQMDRPAKRVEVEVTGVDGQLLANVSRDFAGPPPGTPLPIEWAPKGQAEVMKIVVVGHDTAGFHSGPLELVPWSLSVPHEEVVFDTDQARLLVSEEPKLKAVLPTVKQQAARAGKVVDVKLYIMGHTDTVGPPGKNKKLSRRRARTIARWFKEHGVKVPIYAKGFGEEYPKVPTPDGTAEVRNRRVDYVLAVDPPVEGGGWERVQ